MPSTFKTNLTPKERNLVAQYLFHNSTNGQLNRGIINLAAAKFQLNRKLIRRIWSQAKLQIEEGIPIRIGNKKVGLARSTKILLDGEKLKRIQLQQRGTVRGLAEGLEVSPSTAWRWIQSGLIRSHSNSIKPELTAKCKIARLKFCMHAVFKSIILNNWQFKCMNHVVHIDEKWFYLTKSTERYYLYQDETEPYRSCKSKKFITKVMFLCAVSRPIYNTDGSLIFDGKIGMFPFTQQIAAKRKSRNRAAGTLETKSIDSITKEVIKSCLINQVLPAIKAKWPLTENTNIVIQQDNARPHIDDSDMEFRAAARSDGFNIHLVCQPPSSPDLNINDLGWFRALQALQTKRASYNIDELVDAVLTSFTKLNHMKLNKVFLSLQGCMTEIMKVKGHNNYRQPHMKKDVLIREGNMAENIQIEKELLKQCVQYLVDAEDAEEFMHLVEEFGITKSA